MKKNILAIITVISQVDPHGSDDMLYFMGMPVYQHIMGCGCLRERKLFALFGKITKYVKDEEKNKITGKTVSFLFLSFSLFRKETEYGLPDKDNGKRITIVTHTLLCLPVCKKQTINNGPDGFPKWNPF